MFVELLGQTRTCCWWLWLWWFNSFKGELNCPWLSWGLPEQLSVCKDDENSPNCCLQLGVNENLANVWLLLLLMGELVAVVELVLGDDFESFEFDDDDDADELY